MENNFEAEKQEGFRENLRKEVLEATVKTTQEKIGTLLCPSHGKSPRLKFSEDSGAGKQKMSFDCCCDVLAKMLQKALES